MAWPPPVLPINRTDALNQQATHPADHNAANLAVNDLVAHVQAGDATAAALAATVAGKIGPSSSTGPYVGGWGAGGPIVVRTGHFGGTTSAFGDVVCNFQTAFPNGVIAVTVTPGGDLGGNPAICPWWPFVQSVSLSGINLYALAPQGWPGAGGHPPNKGTVWTLATQPIAFDYVAIGV